MSPNTRATWLYINGLHIAIELGATRLYAYDDSKIVVDQVMKESNCESSLMNA
jgi:ribonuclease HI